MIDGCFSVEKSKWGTWSSIDQDGNKIITSLTEENCINATRWYLKQKQEGFSGQNSVTYEGTVGGKL